MLDLVDLLGPYLGHHPHSTKADPLVVRLAERIDWPGNDVECWPWRGAQAGQGYSQLSIDGRLVGVHRAVYEILVGPIPAGLTLDHTCHDPAVCSLAVDCPHRRCVNPYHCEPVSSGVNTHRGGGVGGRFFRAERCVNGHEFDGVRQGKYRRCNRCAAAATARWRSRQKH